MMIIRVRKTDWAWILTTAASAAAAFISKQAGEAQLSAICWVFTCFLGAASILLVSLHTFTHWWWSVIVRARRALDTCQDHRVAKS